MESVPPDLSDLKVWLLGGPPPMKIHSSPNIVENEPPLLEDYVFGGPPPIESVEFTSPDIADTENIQGWIAIFGHLAVASAILVTLSPIPVIFQIKKEKCVGSIPLLPFSFSTVNAFAWMLYGEIRIFPSCSALLIRNSVHIIMNFYILNFVFFISRFINRSTKNMDTKHYCPHFVGNVCCAVR